jgi:hypothetical protein
MKTKKDKPSAGADTAALGGASQVAIEKDMLSHGASGRVCLGVCNLLSDEMERHSSSAECLGGALVAISRFASMAPKAQSESLKLWLKATHLILVEMGRAGVFQRKQ